MKTHFNSHRIVRKIDAVEPESFRTKQWDSFKMCHNKDDEAKKNERSIWRDESQIRCNGIRFITKGEDVKHPLFL